MTLAARIKTVLPRQQWSMAVMAMVLLAAISGSDHAWASKIAVVVNDTVITTGDINSRVRLLQLQRQKGNLKQKAQEDLIEQAIKMSEAQRTRIIASDAQVDAAFARFAAGNKLTPKQMEKALNQSGVGADHFKEFIRTQMSWPRLVRARFNTSSSGMTTGELVKNMLEKEGEKPSTTEYILQQIIFVVPKSKRNAILASRKREASAMRSRFVGCNSSHEFAKGLHDVSVVDVGRRLQPELPPDWKPLIENTRQGGTTDIKVTDRGVEFIAVCSAKQVSDDQAAVMTFEAENNGNSEVEKENSEKFLKELREKARISYR